MINTDIVHAPRYLQSPKRIPKPPSRGSSSTSRSPWNLGEQSARASILMLDPPRKTSCQFRSCQLCRMFWGHAAGQPTLFESAWQWSALPSYGLWKHLFKTMIRIRLVAFRLIFVTIIIDETNCAGFRQPSLLVEGLHRCMQVGPEAKGALCFSGDWRIHGRPGMGLGV